MKKLIIITFIIIPAFLGCVKEIIRESNKPKESRDKNKTVIKYCETVYIDNQEDLEYFNCQEVKYLYVGNSMQNNPLEIKRYHFETLKRANRISLKHIDYIEENSFNNVVDLFEMAIYDNNLSHIRGFNNLTKMTGLLSIRENNNLISIDGFNKLRSLDGGLSINNNENLNTISGFNNLLEIKGSGLYVNNNRNLKCEELCKFNGKVLDKNYSISENLCKSYQDLIETCNN